MPSLITSSEQSIITGTFSDIFDTRARRIVVYKEPIKTTTSYTPSSLAFGFGESQQQDAYTYTEVTGVYQAVIRYNNRNYQNIEDNSEIMQRISAGDVTIKVRKECRDYINNGKTEKITFDDRTFYLQGEEIFLNERFWFFNLITTK